MKVLKTRNGDAKHRILVRAKDVGRVILNVSVAKDLPFEKLQEKRIAVALPDSDGKLVRWLIHVKEPRDRDLLYDLLVGIKH